jgi:SAM-dependent methyltransferase
VTRLFEARWLRRFATPIRSGAPQLYAVLKRWRRHLLAGQSELDAYQYLAVDRFCRLWLQGRPGARVLEVGSDDRRRVLRALASLDARAVGVNSGEPRADDPAGPAPLPVGATFLRADARELPFADGSFDAVFSVATFEHIQGLPKAIAEMYRVLVPGGIVYASFGPIWSSGKGHHVNAQAGSEEARHSQPEKNPLPDFSHLLLRPDDMRAALASRVVPDLIEPIVHSVYKDPAINRLCYHDYLGIFRNSPFEIGSLRTDDDPVPAPLQRVLSFRHPRESRFDVTNVEVVLRKRRASTVPPMRLADDPRDPAP